MTKALTLSQRTITPLRRTAWLSPAVLLMGCGGEADRKTSPEEATDTMGDTPDTDATDNPTEIPQAEEDTDARRPGGEVINLEPEEPTVEPVTPMEPEPEPAQPNYEILQYPTGLLTPTPQAIYTPEDSLERPPLNQNYAEGYLSVDKNITRFATWSGNDTIDALLFGSPVFPGRTDHVWTGTGAEKVISFSFIDPELLLLDEAAYGYQYDGGEQPINTVYNGAIGAFTDAQKDAIRQAFAEYETYIDLKFVEVIEEGDRVGTLRVGLSLAQYENIAAFALQPARYWASAGDIWLMEEGAGGDLTPGESWYYFAFLHELGHALGLKHPHEAVRDNEITLAEDLDSANYTLMSYNEPDWAWHTVRGQDTWSISHGPQVLDIQALQYLYGANDTHNLGNTVYNFSPDEAVSLTIWDAGGTDILNFSQMKVGVTVSMAPGDYSTVPIAGWSPVDNIGIAFDTHIENAIGSKADDTITGNDLDNMISGHGGDDTLYGGIGDDVFDGHADARAGSDLFHGGPGDDIYYVSTGDLVFEQPLEGSDLVILVEALTYTLPNYVERIQVGHDRGANISGNDLDNVFVGGTGADTFTGGGGADTFLVSAAMGRDTITDFNEAEGDSIQFAADPIDFAYFDTEFGFTLDFGESGSLDVYDANLIA